jgi:hypothetical protein
MLAAASTRAICPWKTSSSLPKYAANFAGQKTIKKLTQSFPTDLPGPVRNHLADSDRVCEAVHAISLYENIYCRQVQEVVVCAHAGGCGLFYRLYDLVYD